MKVYVIDNGGQWTHLEWRALRDIGVKAEIIPNTTPFEKIEDADAIVLSGGAPRVGLREKLGNCDEYLKRAKFPVLGICAGHQYMARFFGGECSEAITPEYGKVEIEIIEKDAIFKGLPDKFFGWENHNDEVVKMPENFSLLASSKYCKVQAMMHNEKPFFGLQFHPEVEHTQYGREIFKNFIELI
ncbi:MAG: GMP synthase subunit A [Thermoplasmatales archaeon]|nr:GMP synthase subunit A [Thermoplasmatales archaeon]